MRWIILVAVAFAFAAGKADRTSFDGVALPPVEKLELRSPPLPYIGLAIGAEPEKLAPKLFNAQKSEALLLKRAAMKMDAEWYALNVGGADIAGVTLRNGRTFKVQLVFAEVRAEKQREIALKIKKPNKLVSVVSNQVHRDDGKSNLVVTFTADGAEWYLAGHQVSNEIATAMRAGTLIDGMDAEQADAIGDGLGVYLMACAAETGPVRGGGVGYVARPGEVVGDPLGLGWERFAIRAQSKADATRQVKAKGWKVMSISKAPAESKVVPVEVPMP